MTEIQFYQSKYDRLRASNDREAFYEARLTFRKYDNKRRQPYIRSKYFDGQKVFLNMFYIHLGQKSPREQRKRIVFVTCAIDLLQHTKIIPEYFVVKTIEYYRFYGQTKSGVKFAVQVMKDKKRNRYFMSCFPIRK
jgi:hypothetical protein